jgi:hypothetical protein
VVFLKKICAASNSSSNSLLFCSCSKNLISTIIGAHEANCFT